MERKIDTSIFMSSNQQPAVQETPNTVPPQEENIAVATAESPSEDELVCDDVIRISHLRQIFDEGQPN